MSPITVTVVVLILGCLAQGTPTGSFFPPATPETDEEVRCSHLSQAVALCRLQDVVRGHDDVNVTVTVNGCHQPVDVTFRMTSSQNLSWNFTFVPNNQNERVYIPGVYLVPPVPVAPTYLYVREPEKEYNSRNQTTEGALITVEASLVTVLSNNMWEEEEFLKHTFQLPPHCPRRTAMPPSPSTLSTWVTRGLLLAAALAVLVALAAAVTMKRRQLLALLTRGRGAGGDDLTLVQHIEQQQHAQAPPSEVIASKTEGNENSKTVINENNNIMNAGQQSEDSQSSPNVQNTTKPGEAQDGGVSVIMESYSLENENRIQSVIPVSNENKDVNVQRNLLGRMKKLKESFQVGLKGITFEALKEDKQSLHGRENPGNLEEDAGVVIANPLFKSKLDTISNNCEDTNNDVVPLDDDLPNDAYFYNRVKMGNRSDSYSNIYHQSGGEGTSDVTTDPSGNSTTTTKLEPMGNIITAKVNNNNNEVSVGTGAAVGSRGGGGIISHAAKNGFGYGSREWLDELEGATAAPPQKHVTGKKKKRSQKTSNYESGKATNGDGSKRGGHEERKNKARKSSSVRDEKSGTAHVHYGSHNGEHSGRRSLGGSTRQVNGSDVGLDARKIVKEVLDNGLFDYSNEHGRLGSNGDASVTNGHTHAPEVSEGCHPVALKGIQNGGVRPKTSWAQASVAT